MNSKGKHCALKHWCYALIVHFILANKLESEKVPKANLTSKLNWIVLLMAENHRHWQLKLKDKFQVHKACNLPSCLWTKQRNYI